MWTGGKIYLYPAHSVDGFLLCSEKDFELMETMVRENSVNAEHVDWKEAKNSEEYKAWVASLKETQKMLEGLWKSGIEFWKELVDLKSNSDIHVDLINALLKHGPLRTVPGAIEYGDDTPVMGVEIGRNELSGLMIAALKAYFEWLLVDVGFESLKYGSEMHNVWNEIVQD